MGISVAMLTQAEFGRPKWFFAFSQDDSLFLKTIYQIWINRNNKKHGKSWASPAMVAAVVLGNFNLVNLSILSKQWDTTRLYSIGLSCCPPPSKWLKVNIDGAFREPYKAGVGVVVRDSAGKIIVAAGKQIMHWDVAYIELQSISLLRDVLNEDIKGAMGIIIEGDNQSTLNWLQKHVNSYPTVRGFTAIGTGGDDFVNAMVVAVESVLHEPIPEDRVTHKLSSRGKYVSVNIGPIRVVSSEQVQAVYNAMRRDERMKYFL
ncbi:hypothetical protein M5K25_008419 [Dendrobium thyrsiflorum]|uniref:RNase H type-1 domain-containing protein n=1 Tax=Dendrobium thyrsiflorum TaxID=117978 RepID=A0ABD0V8J7_DENTH